MLQLDHLTELRRWEMQQAASAPEIDPEMELENDNLRGDGEMDMDQQEAKQVEPPPSSEHYGQALASREDFHGFDDAAALDAFLEAETRELEALVAMHEAASPSVQRHGHEDDTSPTRYWSDDEDMDADFESELFQLGEAQMNTQAIEQQALRREEGHGLAGGSERAGHRDDDMGMDTSG